MPKCYHPRLIDLPAQRVLNQHSQQASLQPQEKSYHYAGPLAIDSGDIRITNHTGKTWIVSAIYAHLGTAPGAGSVGFTATAGGGTWTDTITADESSEGRSDVVASGSYLKVAITGIGTGSAPKDLSVTFVFKQAI